MPASASRSVLPWLLVAIVACDPAVAPAAPGPPELPAEALVLSGVGRRGRGEPPADPVAAAIAAGTWQPPKAGDELPAATGERRNWRAVPIRGGTIALQGVAYAYVAARCVGARVSVLHAIGHSAVYVNGELRGGDIYGNGIMRLPVQFRDGTNDLLFVGGRGPVTVKFEEPRGRAHLDAADTTTPDFVTGSPIDTMAAVLARNNTTETISGLSLDAILPGSASARTEVPPLPPLSVRKIGFRLAGPAMAKVGPVAVRVRLLHGADSEPIDAIDLTLQAVAPGDTHRRTFLSDIDGSVQYYSLVPALPAENKPGLVLTLHGAGVEASGQAACYGRKQGLHVVAPTNRRPYGFDWEDWGRLDALEVLTRAAKELDTDPRRTYLTGHSMGGHGTWHLGVTFPGRFAAIAPSAGWVSFASYGAERKEANPPAELELRRRAAAPSDTLSLVHNLARTGVYVLHGDADDNVPVAQARTMRKELAKFHPDFAYHEQPGAGHWWGNACVDWPPIFEFFHRHELPPDEKVRSVSFRTANPAVSAECHWATIEAQIKPLKISSVDLTHDAGGRSFAGTTENVARLSLDLGHLPPNKPLQVRLDGQGLEAVPWPTGESRIWFARTGETWAPAARPPASVKGPNRAGPFKEAFRNRMAFVYGTHGNAAENAWALAKARFDAEQFWYRGNGSVDVMSDSAFQPAREPERNVILYGHSEMNTAWSPLLAAAPVQVRRGAISVGAREEKAGDLGCLLVYPRPENRLAMVAAVAGTGLHGMRLTDRQPYFMSGVGYPDWTVLDPAGVRGAGFFGNDWAVESGEAAWRK
jgi:poly(3-hydroxybutyrate) depolymerase